MSEKMKFGYGHDFNNDFTETYAEARVCRFCLKFLGMETKTTDSLLGAPEYSIVADVCPDCQSKGK